MINNIFGYSGESLKRKDYYRKIERIHPSLEENEIALVATNLYIIDELR